MKSKLKKDLEHNYLIIEHDINYNEDYQLKMIKANHPKGILEVTGRGIDDCSQYFYEISGKVSVKAVFEKARIQSEDMKSFVMQLLEAISILRSYMLEANRLILNPEYIFYSNNQFYYCFDPVHEESICEAFHTITEYFVSQVNYEDKEAVFFAYELHKATMEENYSIEQVIHRIAAQSAKENMPKLENRKRSQCYDEEDWEEDHIEGKETEQSKWDPLIPLKKLLKKKREPKWGDWNDLLLEEE